MPREAPAAAHLAEAWRMATHLRCAHAYGAVSPSLSPPCAHSTLRLLDCTAGAAGGFFPCAQAGGVLPVGRGGAITSAASWRCISIVACRQLRGSCALQRPAAAQHAAQADRGPRAHSVP
eukprot:7232879-Prymnesium_polylepis.2